MRAATRSTGSLLTAGERTFLAAVGRLSFANPFLPERAAAEHAAVGTTCVASVDDAPRADPPGDDGARIEAALDTLLASTRAKLVAGVTPSDAERGLYEDACLHALRARHAPCFQQLIATPGASVAGDYGSFLIAYDHLFRFPGSTLSPPAPAQVFATGFQMRRAHHHIRSGLLGASRPAAALRAAVWQAIFTCDLRDYLASPEGAMDDISTLVTGPTGTGKEVVARSIGRSSYIALTGDPPRFAASFEDQFSALNLAAMAASLIESELFGHERGAFTGAVRDRDGWLESCARGGIVFLDEIGELDPTIQVKLLRVLENRIFQRLGDTASRRFLGRIISATHRDLGALIHAGTFRQDLYQRLCACSIRTPSLREQLDDAPGERRHLVRFIAGGVRAARADALTDQVEAWIDENLPRDYAWPGNVRQLTQCVRAIFVTGEYHPLRVPGDEADEEDPVRSLRAGTLTESEAMDRYTTIVQAITGNQRETARLLKVHRHTVATRIDHALLARLTEQARKTGKARPAKRR